jgi:hypothetical protein
MASLFSASVTRTYRHNPSNYRERFWEYLLQSQVAASIAYSEYLMQTIADPNLEKKWENYFKASCVDARPISWTRYQLPSSAWGK